MLKLDFRGDLKELVKAPNIADLMSDDDCRAIGRACQAQYQRDKASRSQWESWYAESLKLAMMLREEKTYPWPGASNVRFPLMAIAVLNFAARAYPALISADRVVKCKVNGADPEGGKSQRAVRVAAHMNYQLLDDSTWEEQTDKSLVALALFGTMFKKVVRGEGTNCSDLVLPYDLVVNYFATDLVRAPASHVFPKWPNELHEEYELEMFRRPPERVQATTPQEMGPVEAARDEIQMMVPPEPSANEPIMLVEQSCWLDLDGDGYAEPYFVTFHRDTGFVYRIFARYVTSGIEYGRRQQVVRIKPEQYYVKYSFIPSVDGGFYDTGLGLLLGPLSHSIDTLINQIIDAGKMSILAGGFLGRGVRIKAGNQVFDPFEWKQVETSGASLKDNIVPLPVREVSPMLLQLLQYLVGYGERVASATELQTGASPIDNTKAKVAEIANENGRLAFDAIFKRVWRALKFEFKLWYRLNQLYATQEDFTYGNNPFQVTPKDYEEGDKGICPVADPNIVSQTQRKEQAMLLKQTASTSPGYDMYQVDKNLFEVFGVTDIDRFLPPPGSERAKALTPPPSVQMLEVQVKQQLAQTKAMEVQFKAQEGMGKLQVQMNESQARIFELYAKGQKALAEAKGVDADNITNMMNLAVQQEKSTQEGLKSQMDLLKTIIEATSSVEEARINAQAAKAKPEAPKQ